uniref:Uncharacterized protein n=1 Tax=Aegilops tauschii subsp. strangulata TaxID=200361 RepID=A0A453AHK6_AEGTS
VSATTLGVMKEQFQIGNEVCQMQEIEMKQADWADLFEPLGDPPSSETAVSC